MGCGGSKAVDVHANTNSHETNTETQQVQVNVFVDTTNNNAQGGSCYNAKPRLQSAIRRGDDIDIKPVDSTTNNKPDEQTVEAEPSSRLDLIDQTFESEVNLIGDSGFDINRANSEASDWVKLNVREDTESKTGRHSHNSSITARSDTHTIGSVVTARDLNASFVTTSDDYYTSANGDVTFDLETPLGDLTDVDDSQFRTLSNTPSQSVHSVEPTPISMHPKIIEVIKEESEGGFTPRSIFDADGVISHQDGDLAKRLPDELPKYLPKEPLNHTVEELPKYIPEELPTNPPQEVPKYPMEELPQYETDEVLRHNQNSGWCEWGIYKGKVFDSNKVINVFDPIHDEHVKLNNNKAGFIDDENDSDIDEDDSFESKDDVQPFIKAYPCNILNPTRSLGNAIKILLKIGIDINTVNQNLQKCMIGQVVPTFSSQYWNTFRKEIDSVLNDLNRADYNDELSQNVKDVLEQLQRWVLKYRGQNPQPPPPQSGDPNVKECILPDGVREHPERLRRWVESWEQFDLEIPESGAWITYEVEDIDLGDPHEILLASLRSHVDLDDPPIVAVDGEAAWEVLQPGIFKEDIMTEEQRRTEESRQYRSDLHDPKRMERRRGKLLEYFVRKYEMNGNNVNHFLQWAQSMEEGNRKFQVLCQME